MQGSLRYILQKTTPEFFAGYVKELSTAATLCVERIQQIPGLSCPSKPQGSMFVMVSTASNMYKQSEVKRGSIYQGGRTSYTVKFLRNNLICFWFCSLA